MVNLGARSSGLAGLFVITCPSPRMIIYEGSHSRRTDSEDQASGSGYNFGGSGYNFGGSSWEAWTR